MFFQDANYYLKTHFQNLTQNEHSVRTGTITKQTGRPASPYGDSKQGTSKIPEDPSASKIVDQYRRDRYEKRKLKEKHRRQDDSDNEQNYEAERQKQRREEENRRIRKWKEEENKRRNEDKKLVQEFTATTRQVKGQTFGDRNKNCSATQTSWYV